MFPTEPMSYGWISAPTDLEPGVLSKNWIWKPTSAPTWVSLGKLVAVTEEVYYAYYHMGRQRRTQVEKDGRRQVASYDALDTEDSLGIDLLVDRDSPSMEEMAIANVMAGKLRRCLALLPRGEQELLHALYFEGQSERKYAETIGITQKAVNKRRHKGLAQLKILMKK